MSHREPVKVSRSLSLPRQMGGADRGLAIANGTMTLLLCYSSRSGWFLPLGIIGHFALRWLSQRDPWWRDILLQYNRYPDIYDSVPATKSSPRFKRPYGFDQDLPC
jgi:type IV secretion system protein TrbD